MLVFVNFFVFYLFTIVSILRFQKCHLAVDSYVFSLWTFFSLERRKWVESPRDGSGVGWGGVKKFCMRLAYQRTLHVTEPECRGCVRGGSLLEKRANHPGAKSICPPLHTR